MQQDGGGGDHHHQDMKPSNQDKRVMKATQGENQAQAQQHQPQKCPRCESMNTKFCYYNNYSLSQPRYFCKTCRRYWTQGGTLRNVPVGGGCRKGKRARLSSSSTADISRFHATSQQPQQLMTKPQNLTISSPQSVASGSAAAALRTKDHQHHRHHQSGNLAKTTTVPSGISSYYSGSTHGSLSSLAAIQSANQPPPDSFQQHLHQIGVGDGSSNVGGMLQGFNIVPSFGGSSQFYNKSTANLLYLSEDSLINQSSNRPASASSSDWHQNFINNSSANLAISGTALWNTSTTTTTGNTNSNNNTGSSALNPSQWPNHLPGYGPPS